MALAVIAVLAAIGWYSGRDQIDRYRMMKAARTLHADLVSLRTLAVSTNREARILFVASDEALDPADVQSGEWLLQVGNRSSGSSEWDTLPIDLPGDPPDSSEGERSLAPGGSDELPGTSLAPWPTLVGPGSGNADAIVFSPRGWVANPPSDFADGYILLQIVNKRALWRGVDERVDIRLARTGIAHLETGPATAWTENVVGAEEASTP